MKTIVIVAADGAIASNITGVLDFFNYCNTYWRTANGDEVSDLFECVVVSSSGHEITTSLGIKIPVVDVDSLTSIEAVILASATVVDEPSLERYVDSMRPMFGFIRQIHERNIAIGAFCSSSIILAECGLLDDRNAVSSWWLSELFTRRYPKVNLCLEKLVVNDSNLYTGGATTAYLSLCLKLVEQMAGEQVSAQMAKVLLVDPNRSSQIPYMTMRQVGGHKDERVKTIQRWMQHHMADSFSLDDLAERFALSKRTLSRRFKQSVGDTPVNYLQRLRVEEAKRLLETTSNSLEVIVSKVGYGDVSSFRKLFVQLTELSPKAYRQRFNLAYA